MTQPAPSSLWVMINENPDSVNDAAFAVKMEYQGRGALWQDGPATYHGGGCGFNFADGHSEIRKWKDPRTLTGTMKTTYKTTFSFGTTRGRTASTSPGSRNAPRPGPNRNGIDPAATAGRLPDPWRGAPRQELATGWRV